MKANPNQGQNRYVIGGLAIPLTSIAALECACNDLAEKVFGSRLLTQQTEFHASHIYFGKGAFKGRSTHERIEVLRELGLIVNRDPDVRRVFAAIDTAKLYAGTNPAKVAFAYFCERTQMLAGKSGASLLIGDYDDEGSRQMIQEFANFRANGATPWDYGMPVPSIVDAVHFVSSHQSRMIQLADVYLFLLSHTWGSRKGWMAESLSKAIIGVELYGHRHKYWPN